ncbi:hypothetical protein HYH03_013046 [Edaphochlamys debaryana]|uniref:Uncharacterized protein n=1 Tax=Edaphochlamys debaryana TaxID=47281 RepID=A0A835XQQ6_9CHLO|nr:hypothetical protein HYH03_013046 [Edaphochlamys debaryana]|eukprot:KAG2488356.1 hypothetical protein HYH03_013046 [Edaphochlamys debaryana]
MLLCDHRGWRPGPTSAAGRCSLAALWIVLLVAVAATDFPHVDNPLQDFVLVQVAALNADPIAQQLNEHYAYYPDLAWAVPNPGDDDTQFYITGAQRLVAQFDPEQPLALSDHYWYMSSRPQPYAPRCLPCHFNTSLLINNTAAKVHNAYVPRPACPFSTRAFACAHYDDTQLCSDRHDAVLREAYSPRFLGGLRHQAEVAQAGGVKGNETARREEVRRLNAKYAEWYRVSREETPGTQQHLPGTFGAAVYGKAWISTALPFPFCVRHDARVHMNDTERQSGAEQCNFPIFHGGAGAVFSVGLMLALDLDAAESFIAATPGESDSLLSRAISYQGFGFTDPGVRHRLVPRAVPHHYHLFDGRGPVELSSEMAFLECQQGAALRTWIDIVVAEITQRVETHRALLALAASLKEDPRDFVLVQVAALNADPIAQQLNEHYAYYPDLAWAVPNPGDDDTQFYITGAQRLVAQFDPEQPLALSDHYWYMSSRPQPYAPRCLPCHFNTSLLINNTAAKVHNAYVPRPACPFSTRAFACAHYDDTQLCSDRHDAVLREAYSPRFLGGLRHQAEVAQAGGVKGNETARREEVRRLNAKYAEWYRVSREETPGTQQHLPGTFGAAVYGKAWISTALPFPFCVRHDARVHMNDTERQSGAEQCNFPIFHGGAGAVFSVGLMLALDLDAAESFIAATPGESDSLLSRAISYQGFGFTDPGVRHRLVPRAVPHHYHLFDGRGPVELSSEMAFLECQQGAALRTWIDIVVAEITQRVETHRALLALAASLKEDPRVRSRNMTLWHAMREVVCARPRPPPPPGPPPAPPSPVPSPPRPPPPP